MGTKFISQLFTALLFVFLSGNISAQLIIADPVFPTDDQLVTITFDASLGSAGLAGYSGDVYAHTGVITSNSTSASDWKYVVTNWGENTPATKLTNIGTDLYTLEIEPSIREYYNVPAGETILQMAFVFRSDVAVGGSYLEGKTISGGDIFVDVYEPGLNVSFVLPDQSHLIVEMSDQIDIEIQAVLSDSVALYKNDTLVSKVSGTSLQTTITADANGKTWLTAKAWDISGESYDSLYYFIRPPIVVEDPPAGTEYGINYIDDETVVLCLHAPYKNYVFALGDFSNWELDESVYMKKNTNGDVYWLKLENLTPGQEYIYQYYVDGEIKIADPYTEKVSDPWNDHYIEEETYPGLISYPAGKTIRIASVFQTAQTDYTWTVNNFVAPDKKDLVIYELLVRDFTDERNFKTLLDSLSYLSYLGVNAIELMPVNEFEGNHSWGYNSSFYFAVDKFYGPKNLLKEFIDSCHVKGIAVIMDIVLNHAYGQNTMAELYWNPATNQPAGNNPWFNTECPHPPYCWGNDWN
ncbi:MAG: alpha-amylase family glycosyl hydrolase, partial [Bacteroidota bacterium]|nr:alpha-amylase family glycosyl hydrolase [Bacteroidota bacterium]